MKLTKRNWCCAWLPQSLRAAAYHEYPERKESRADALAMMSHLDIMRKWVYIAKDFYYWKLLTGRRWDRKCSWRLRHGECLYTGEIYQTNRFRRGKNQLQLIDLVYVDKHTVKSIPAIWFPSVAMSMANPAKNLAGRDANDAMTAGRNHWYSRTDAVRLIVYTNQIWESTCLPKFLYKRLSRISATKHPRYQ